MAKVVRLTAEESREWHANLPQLVNNQGVPVTVLSPELENASAKVMHKARHQGKALKEQVMVPAAYDHGGRITKTKKVEVEVTMVRTGKDAHENILICYVSGMMKVTTRDIMKARLYKKYGECLIQRVNGKFLCKLTDPLIIKKVPAPEIPSARNCECKNWGGPHPGRHYASCQYNLLAPEHERSLTNDISIADMKAARLKEKKAKVLSPEECGCKDWEGHPEKSQEKKTVHHAVCIHHDDWILQSQNTAVHYLVRMTTKQVAREAYSHEIAEAQSNDDGPIITIDNDVYLVLDKTQVGDIEFSDFANRKPETHARPAHPLPDLPAFTRAGPEDFGGDDYLGPHTMRNPTEVVELEEQSQSNLDPQVDGEISDIESVLMDYQPGSGALDASLDEGGLPLPHLLKV